MAVEVRVSYLTTGYTWELCKLHGSTKATLPRMPNNKPTPLNTSIIQIRNVTPPNGMASPFSTPPNLA